MHWHRDTRADITPLHPQSPPLASRFTQYLPPPWSTNVRLPNYSSTGTFLTA